MTADDWSAATFDGLVTAQRRSIAEWTARQRWESLAEAVELAVISGAVARTLTEKQRVVR